MAGLVEGIKGGIKRLFGSQEDNGAGEATDVGSPTILLQTVCKLPESSASTLPLHTTLTPCLLSSTMRPRHHHFLQRFHGAPPHQNRLPRR